MSALCLEAQNNPIVVFYYDDNGNRTGLDYTVIRIDDIESIKDANDIFDEIMSVYPNPTTGYLVLTSTINSNESYLVSRLISVQGKLIVEKRLISEHTEFDLTQLSAGIYFLSVECDEEKHMWKIIKQ